MYTLYGIPITSDYLSHSGVKGQKKGIRHYQSYEVRPTRSGMVGVFLGKESERIETVGSSNTYRSDSELSDFMKKNFTYKTFSSLKDHDQMEKEKAGDCHSQVMYEMQELRKLGKNPKAKFIIQVDPKTGQGGMTHSFVYYNDKGKIVWFENAWGGNEGVHKYDSYSDLKKDVESMFKSDKYPSIYWGNFDDKKMRKGMSLQEVVDKCLR